MKSIFAGALFVAAGIWLLATSSSEGARLKALVEKGARAQAVIEWKNAFHVLVPKTKGRPVWEWHYYVHAKLKLADGRDAVLDPRVSESFYQSTAEGDAVELAYDPNDLHQYVFVNDLETRGASRREWRYGLAFALIGLGVASYGWYSLRKAARSEDEIPPAPLKKDERVVRVG